MFPPERKEKAKRKWKPKPSLEVEKEAEVTKFIKTEDIKFEPRKENKSEFESLCESCNCKRIPNGCKCIPLDSDWVEFLSDQLWS